MTNHNPLPRPAQREGRIPRKEQCITELMTEISDTQLYRRQPGALGGATIID
jgi:hypothetical protein